jgi:hypothetical protein
VFGLKIATLEDGNPVHWTERDTERKTATGTLWYSKRRGKLCHMIWPHSYLWCASSIWIAACRVEALQGRQLLSHIEKSNHIQLDESGSVKRRCLVKTRINIYFCGEAPALSMAYTPFIGGLF